MREIKFRFTFKNGNFIAQRFKTLSELLDCSFAQEEMEEDIWCSKDFEDEPQLELIAKDEFTGLKDKNGVEIYEGDLIQFITESDVYKIGWSDVYLQYHVFSKHDKNLLDLCECENYEVIGNIYENKELLDE